MLSPRDNFRNSPHAKGWEGIMDSRQFQAGCEAALAQMVIDQPHTPESLSVSAFRFSGAKEFLRVLMGLTATETKMQTAVKQNLDHKA